MNFQYKTKGGLIKELQKLQHKFDSLLKSHEKCNSEHKQTEEALRTSMFLLKKSQEIAHLGSWEYDLTKNHLTWSDEVYRMFGISPREFLATNEAFLDVVHPEDRTAIDAAYKESLHQNLDSYDNEHRIILKNTGEIRYVHERCENIRDSSGRFIRSVGMVQDITERRQAEEKLVKLNECFLKFGPDTLVNINLLVALSGELMGGTCALYNCLQGGMLCSLGQWNTPPGYQSVDHPEGHLCNDVIKSTGETTVIIRDLQNTSYALTDPNVRLYRLKTYIGKAVKFNNINIGSLCVVFQRDIIPGNNEIRLMEIIASAIGVEEARKQAEEEIRKSKKLLEDLHKHLTEILENERALIAREIHDQIGQSLTALKLDINRMKEFVGSNPEAVAMLRGMIELVTNTIKDVQRISSELRPGILDDLGLVSAIEWYCGEFKERTGIKCSLKLDDSFTDDSQKSLIFFRVFQETLTNVIRHARASSVNIKLHQSDKGTTLTIQDNGIGIPEEKIESQKSLGLINMRERVKQFNGKIDFSSKKGEGTKLTIFIPS